MFMKTFEEKWTAWLDGELSEQERLEFEASLPDKTAAEVEKRDARKLGTLLKEQLGAHVLSNADFFNHQLQQRIAQESAPALGSKPHSRSVVVDDPASLLERRCGHGALLRLRRFRNAGKEIRPISLNT